ncbi:hypothetical protein MASR1M36_06000 [Candidatus Cloacimonadaceae bacterium]
MELSRRNSSNSDKEQFFVDLNLNYMSSSITMSKTKCYIESRSIPSESKTIIWAHSEFEEFYNVL